MSAPGAASGPWTPVNGGRSGARVWRGAGVHRKQDAPDRIAARSLLDEFA